MRTVSYPYPNAPLWAVGHQLGRAMTVPEPVIDPEDPEAEPVVPEPEAVYFLIMSGPPPADAEVLGKIVAVSPDAVTVEVA